jgi:hypothetical protein
LKFLRYFFALIFGLLGIFLFIRLVFLFNNNPLLWFSSDGNNTAWSYNNKQMSAMILTYRLPLISALFASAWFLWKASRWVWLALAILVAALIVALTTIPWFYLVV